MKVTRNSATAQAPAINCIGSTQNYDTELNDGVTLNYSKSTFFNEAVCATRWVPNLLNLKKVCDVSTLNIHTLKPKERFKRGVRRNTDK